MRNFRYVTIVTDLMKVKSWDLRSKIIKQSVSKS
jgi:hypothetical protein